MPRLAQASERMNAESLQNNVYTFLISQAVKAPSGHNTQPWRFEVGERHIVIRPDYTKTLKVVDPDHRELFVSLGCAVENLCIAASVKGYFTEVLTDEEGNIAVNLTAGDATQPNPLFDQLDVRQTNRSIYNGRCLDAETEHLLNRVPLDSGVGMHLYARGTEPFGSIADFIVQGNTRQLHDPAFLQELQGWMRYNKKHQDRTNDGLSYAVFGAPNLPVWVVKPIMKQALTPAHQNKGDVKKIQSSSHFVVFTTQKNRIVDWINLGRSLERFLLTATAAGVAHAYMNQPAEIQDLAMKMADVLKLTERFPVLVLRLGYSGPVAYSKRKPIREVMFSNTGN